MRSRWKSVQLSTVRCEQKRGVRTLLGLGFALTALAHAPDAHAQQPAACLSDNPAHWPAPAKPYFMFVVDTSGSMSEAIAGSNSCGYPNNRNGHLRCAIKNTVEAFSGQVNFGLSTYAWKLDGSCGATCADCTGSQSQTACFPGCTATFSSFDDGFCGPKRVESSLGNASIHLGGYVRIPVLQDNFWSPPLPPSNAQAIVNLLDNRCDNGEIGASGNGPVGGALFTMHQYFAGTYRDPFGVNYPNNSPLASPIGPATYAGQPAERTCRPINVILITEADENCDTAVNPTPIAGGCRSGLSNYPNTAGEALAAHAADKLWTTGVTVSGQSYRIKTHVVGLGGNVTKTALDNIASCGGTGSSHLAANETALTQALATIVNGSFLQEVCDNEDNNCNGCIDEGTVRYCNRHDLSSCCSWKTQEQRTACGANACACCNWATSAERTACLDTYRLSITEQNPDGDRAFLPCTTTSQMQNPATWLCHDPGDVCDDVDNNCNGATDEGVTKCGNPPHCPQPEVCNGQDDDCDGTPDQGNVCGQCTWAAEVCNGCDDDCDGITDNGMSVAIPCGISGEGIPDYCQGVASCKPPQAVAPGACVAGGGVGECVLPITPPAETCNGLDDDCNGNIDDGLGGESCVPGGTSPDLKYYEVSQCRFGTTACTDGELTCEGFIGPSEEVCDGVDNDCDGVVDNDLGGEDCVPEGTSPNLIYSGNSQCKKGTSACAEGDMRCEGFVGPSEEVCDGIDNDCDGIVDNPDDGACAQDPDGGTGDPDGGSVDPTDGGSEEPVDGGSEADSGVATDGGSNVPSDGGTEAPNDGGSVPNDSGTSLPDADVGNGVELDAEPEEDGSGCSCEVGPGASSNASGYWLLAAMGAALTARKRRR